ncbi:hypothetical protein Cgig2_015841 [Carnegiea gigantea]|uniref:DUF4283 domain-containing protein n=1 Tax=Carnegiea gigantea TaxID=171969 RepID=A0A9Q1KGZ8_9CARY|nr:hypothetical protein Cgig2_015841 [Carnegiea gigantea]
MSSSLEDVWNKLTLIGAEEEIMIVGNVGSDEKDDHIALCLYGKLLAKKTFNPTAIKTVFRNIWRPDDGVLVRDLDVNLFAVQFFSMVDRDMVLLGSPWSFNGLVVKDLLGLLQRLSPNVVVLSETKCSKAKINSISSQLGDFTGVVADAQGRDGSTGLLWDEL